MALPNIVFIMADDMGYGDVERYNADSLIPTPNIDRIADEGVMFTDAHSGCALCTPTRYGLITGRCYWRTPKRHSLVMPYDPPTIPPERLTIARMLKDAGYRTACVGKWHLGLWYREKKLDGYRHFFTTNEDDIDFSKPIDGGPVDLGFDYFFGTAGCSTSDAPYCFIKDRHTVGIPTIRTSDEMNSHPGVYPGLMVEDWDQEQVDTTFAAEATGFIDRHVAEKRAEPFFLYYALSAPHIPWLNPEFIRGASKEGPRGDMNALVDWCVGQVRETLSKHGILDDTLFIFTSDNGPQKGENGHKSAGEFRGFKNSPYEGGHRVPFVARCKGRVAPGTTSDVPISLTDMMATFAQLVGVELPDGAAEDSFGVLNAITGDGPPPERPCLVADTGWHAAEMGNFSIRRDNWKLIEHNSPDPDDGVETRYELFDIAADPYEKTDRAADHADVLESMKDLLTRVREAKGQRFLADA
jgi:arylsulfatase A-like enzyme